MGESSITAENAVARASASIIVKGKLAGSVAGLPDVSMIGSGASVRCAAGPAFACTGARGCVVRNVAGPASATTIVGRIAARCEIVVPDVYVHLSCIPCVY
jgi:hypothetical protein